MSEVRWKMYMKRKISASLQSTYQKLLKLMKI